MITNQPIISIVLPSFNSAETIYAVLTGLFNCRDVEYAEIIVVDSGTDDTAEIVKENFPLVRLYKCTCRKLPGEARNIGWKHATSSLVAFLDSDCIVDSDWICKIIRSMSDTDIVGVTGAFLVQNPQDNFGLVSFASELGGSLPGHPGKYARLAPTGNTTYRKTILEAVGGFIENGWCEDTIFSMQISKRDEFILFEPTICVHHINRTGVKALFSAMLRSGRESGVARSRYALRGSIFAKNPWLIPLLIPYRLLNIYLVNFRGKNPNMGKLIILFPVVFIAVVYWSKAFWSGVKIGRAEKVDVRR